MTYCCAMLLDEGLVMASDSRTNAGVDRVSTFRKMFLFEKPGERVMALVTAGNLSITQSMVSLLEERLAEGWEGMHLYNAPNMFEAARTVGDALRDVYERDVEHLRRHGVNGGAEALFGGQIGGERPRLFRLYEAGNFIEASQETPYFQIGENKYGKPILDRVIGPETSLERAGICALISFDSTMRANISVGPPIDMWCYRRDSLAAGFRRQFDEDDPYFNALRSAWGDGLKHAFAGLPEPGWGL